MRDAGGPLPAEFVIVRAYNNNVAAAQDKAGREYVLMGRGIGFNASQRPRVSADAVDRIFRPTASAGAERLLALLGELSDEHLRLADAARVLVEQRLGISIGDGFVIGIADHLTSAVQRARDEQPVELPLAPEMAYTFPLETEIALEIVAMLRHEGGIVLPSDEASAFALHIVNARFGGGEMPETFALARVLSAALQLVEDAFGGAVDRSSADAARFATHLRFLVARLHAQRQHQDASEFLWSAAKTAHPREHDTAVAIGRVLAEVTGLPIRREEELYLTLHVLRLTASA